MPTTARMVLNDTTASLRGVAGGVRRWLRSLRDGWLHSRRNRRALHLLDRLGYPRSVCFVCHGNVCRSPYAAERFRAIVASLGADAPRTASAGFIGPDRAPPAVASAVARERGLDTVGHRSRVLGAGEASSFDLVVVMEPDQIALLDLPDSGVPVLLLGDLDPRPVTSRAIPDPWDCPIAVFREVFGRIDRCVAVLAGCVTRRAVGTRAP